MIFIYCIYLHRNLINNKIYIGQTKHGENPNIRWKNGYGYSKQKNFYDDILKYGWENFDHIILIDNLTLEQANEFEPKFIELYSVLEETIGYNQCKGGNNFDLSNKKLTAQQENTHNFNLIKEQYFNDEQGKLKYIKTPEIIKMNYEHYLEKNSKYT